ncbi:hypothetical protein M0811_07133 [Anaeramoeba ignava]|uniref:CYRIA/CYRIB Rac1 binding domain-containing protein n=1 Tax=Anaeramoeba ignava TaxID=1746090 RepID=A0A9Q0LQC0_ANAIG|nr:hypothetical protein M0811_07133 [Anaeramoeba ignava]
MGQLLRYFSSTKEPLDIFLDLENARPKTTEETTVYEQVSDVLKQGPDFLNRFRNLPNCSNEVRQAISSPNVDTETKAWNAVLPIVQELGEIFLFSNQIEKLVPLLLGQLCVKGGDEAKDRLVSQQALAKQLGDVIDLVLDFDDIKMHNTTFQNDFSYYRRVVSRFDNQKINLFCLRGMVGCIILYDHIEKNGAFAKKSPIMIKACLNSLLNFQPKQEALINALKYSTKHLKDPETPSAIKQLLEN